MEHELPIYYESLIAFYLLLSAGLITVGMRVRADLLRAFLKQTASYLLTITPAVVLIYILVVVSTWS